MRRGYDQNAGLMGAESAAAWLGTGGRLFLAMLSGLAYALCFPPVELHALAWLALGPLFVAIAGSGPRLGFALMQILR